METGVGAGEGVVVDREGDEAAGVGVEGAVDGAVAYAYVAAAVAAAMAVVAVDVASALQQPPSLKLFFLWASGQDGYSSDQPRRVPPS